MGYFHAGFDIVGVDHIPQPRFPFEFIQADALDYLKDHATEYDIIHASPPCQAYSRTQAIWGREYPKLIEPTRRLLLVSGVPYVIEMVTAKPLQGNITMLCGLMFNLKVFRHRYFETSIPIASPDHPSHKGIRVVKVGRSPHPGDYMSVAGHFSNVSYAGECMGIDWMIGRELAQAIPPAYTEYVGNAIYSKIMFM